MKAVALVCLLFVVASLAVHPHKPKVKDTPEQNLIFFVEGLAYGVEAEVGNITECMEDLNITLADFEKGFADISQGIDWLDIFQIEKGLKEWSAGVTEVNEVLKVCGAEKLAEDIAKIVAEVSSGTTGLLEFVAKEILNILDNGVGQLFRQAVDAWEANNYYDSGKYCGEALGILLNDKK